MTAETIAVGTELLLGDTVDTNSATLGKVLARFGISHTHRQTVGDDVDLLSEALTLALSRSDIVFTVGGLGPTTDDLTRQGIVSALQDEMIFDETIETTIREKLRNRKIPFVPNQKNQAFRPSCSRIIVNPNGTAPGLICEKNGKVVVAMPGPPNEFLPMLRDPVTEFLSSVSSYTIHSRTLRIAGIGESIVEQKLGAIMHNQDPTVAPYAKTGEVHLRLTSSSAKSEVASKKIAEVEATIRGILGDAIYGTDEQSLEQVVLQLLRDNKQTLAVAESCTGGGLGGRLTGVAGASDVFVGGVISYSCKIKMKLLGVKEQTLGDHGAVSEQCAEEMALGVRSNLNVDWGVSITGIAGPNSDNTKKPVGLVYICIASPSGTTVFENNFPGERQAVRDRSIQQALVMLRECLLRKG